MASREQLLSQGFRRCLLEVNRPNGIRLTLAILFIAGVVTIAASHISHPQIKASLGDATPPKTLPLNNEFRAALPCSYTISETIQQKDGSINLKGSGVPGQTLDIRDWPEGVLWVQGPKEVAGVTIGEDGSWSGTVTPPDKTLTYKVSVTDRIGCQTTVFSQKK